MQTSVQDMERKDPLAHLGEFEQQESDQTKNPRRLELLFKVRTKHIYIQRRASHFKFGGYILPNSIQ